MRGEDVCEGLWRQGGRGLGEAAAAAAEAAAGKRAAADPRVQSAARIGGYWSARDVARKLIREDAEYQAHVAGLSGKYAGVRDELAASALDLVTRMAAAT